MTNPRFAKAIVWINGAVPAALLLWDAWHDRLGANPVNFALRTTGLLSLIFVVLTLLVTPLRQLTGINALFPHRRTLGLYAAFHAFAHFGIFFWWDRQASVSSTLSEIVARQYIWYGAIALLIFIPLTITSTAGMMRRLGPTRWKNLHRLVYVAAIGGAVHYLLLNKVVTTQSIVFASVIGALLVYRVVAAHVLLRRAYAKLQSTIGTGNAIAANPSRPKFWTGQLRVAKVFDETPDVRTFRFTGVEQPGLPFDFLPGQYLNLALTLDGKRVNRSYTIASSPSRSAYCEITVKRDGLASRHLHANVHEGDVLSVSAPAGRFTFTGSDAESIVMIAGGVGITPLMSKIRYLTDIGWTGDIYLSYSVRAERDLIFRDELNYLQQRHPNLHVLLMLTRIDGPISNCLQGRLTRERLLAHAPRLRESVVHICGPDAMLEPTRQMLRELGLTDDRIFFESFASPSRAGIDAIAPIGTGSAIASNDIAPVGKATDSTTLTFGRSGRSTTVSADRSILDAAEDLGVKIDFDCRSGICGTCRTKLLSGQVQMETQDALSEKDRNENFILACQARCVGPVTVDA